MGKIMNKREDKLMHLLWRQKESVSIDDMQKKIPDEKISKVTLFKAVQSLYKKGYIIWLTVVLFRAGSLYIMGIP